MSIVQGVLELIADFVRIIFERKNNEKSEKDIEKQENKNEYE